MCISSDRTQVRVCSYAGRPTQSFTDKVFAKKAQQPLIGSVWILPVEGHKFMGFQLSLVDVRDPASTRSGTVETDNQSPF